jgi:hypothetical protein
MSPRPGSEWEPEPGLTPAAGVSIETRDGAVHATPLVDADGETRRVRLTVVPSTADLTTADASILVTALLDMGSVDGKAHARMAADLRAMADRYDRAALALPGAVAPLAAKTAGGLRAVADGLDVAAGLRGDDPLRHITDGLTA